MDTNNVERNLRSLRRLYGLLRSNANNIDEDTQFLLETLLDYTTNEILASQSKIIAAAQFGLTETIPSLNVPDSSSTTNNTSQICDLLALGNRTIKRNVQQVTSIERIETALSAFSFRANRDEKTKSSEGYDTQRMSKTRSNSKIAPSLTSVNEATEAIVDLTLPPRSQTPDDDQFVRAAPLPPKPVGFKKVSQGKRMLSMIKPTLLDQETESWDGSESDDDEEEVLSIDQESEETESRSSGSSWETQEESVSEEDETESKSSYTSESEDDDDESEASASSPSPKKRGNLAITKQRKKAVMGGLTRFKNKFGQVFQLHQHHHHHHHKPSAWNHLQKALHYKRKEKAVEKRMKSEFKGLTTQKKKGGHFHGLVEGLMRHRKRASTKQKSKFPSHGRKKHWWQTYKRQNRIKFPKRGRVKLGKKHYLLNKDPET